MSNKELRNNIGAVTALLAFLFGFGLTVAGFCVPPVGVVHDSVLYVLGQCLIYTGTVLGISTHYESKVKEFEVRIKNKLNNKDESDIK